jgi:hypothetical protein
MADEYGDLDRQIHAFAPKAARHKALRAKIEEAVKEHPADLPALLQGKLYQLQLSPRKNERTLTDKAKAWALLRKVLGIEALIAAVTIPLTLLDKWVPKDRQAGFVSEARTGTRIITVVALAPPGKAA